MAVEAEAAGEMVAEGVEEAGVAEVVVAAEVEEVVDEEAVEAGRESVEVAKVVAVRAAGVVQDVEVAYLAAAEVGAVEV